MADSEDTNKEASPCAEEQEAEAEVSKTVERTSPTECTIKIEADAGYLEKRYQQELAELRAEVVLPGFRRGKAPLGLVERRMGSVLRTDLITSVVAEAYDAAIEENALTVVGEVSGPEADEIDWHAGQPYSYEIKCEVMPAVDVEEEHYKGLHVEAPVYEASDELVEAELERFAGRFATYEPVEGEGIDRDDYVAGEIRAPEADWRRNMGFYPAADKIGPFAVEGLKGALMGAKAGDTLELEGQAEEDDVSGIDELAHLAGKRVKIEFEIQTVTRRKVPAVDDDLAKKIGMESAAEIESFVRERLDDALKQRSDQSARESVVAALLAKVPCEMPDGLVDRATREEQVRRLIRLLRAGVPRQEAEKTATESQFETREMVARRLAATYVLRKVAEKERINITESEVDGQIRAFAADQGWREERARSYLEERGMVRALREDMREEATITFLLENAELKEVPA